MDITALASAGAGALAGLVTAWVALRRDSREARATALAEATQTIEILHEQTEILKQAAGVREKEWRRETAAWHTREDRLEQRITDLERDYRDLVLTVTTMGLCANAATCSSYNAGDRRKGRPRLHQESETSG